MTQRSLSARFTQTKLIVTLSILLCTNTAAKAEEKIKQPSFDINNANITYIEKAITSHQTNCETIIRLYLNRIKQYNLDTSSGAAINAFASLNPSAITEAKHLDEAFQKTGKLVGPLHCIPTVVKDNIDTYDSTSTSGSLALLGSQPNQDAFLVSKIRKAGGIIIGKGTMDEFASGMIGISSRSGRTGNAYNPLNNPGGSSGGPAAAVSANFALIGIGTDNSGSVRVPAAFNGINGLRPSMGLISRSGIFPRGNLDGIAGPLTRSVQDMATVLSVIAKPDRSDPETLRHPRIQLSQKTANFKNLKGMRFGVIRSGAHFNPFEKSTKDIQSLFAAFFSKLKTNGAQLIDINLPDFNVDRKNNMAGEVQQINEYLSSFPSTRKNFTDICTSGRTNMFGNREACIEHIQKTADMNNIGRQKAKLIFKNNRKYITELMKKNQLDALIMPIASSGKATYHPEKVNTWQLPISSNSGLPAIVVNAGYTHSNPAMPVGIEFIGKFYDENTLLQIAQTIESNISPRKKSNIETRAARQDSEQFNIAQYNNLLTEIGYKTYINFLQKHKPEALTPSVFNTILNQSLHALESKS